MSKKLAEKAGLIKLPPVVRAPDERSEASTAAETRTTTSTAASPVHEARARTAPGAMAAFLGTQSAAVREAEELRTRLQAHEGAIPARRIDPRLVRASSWANRAEASFGTAAFEELKQEIASSGGNVQPVKVRRVSDAREEYELVYGHRRHRACLQLGLPLLALIEDVDDATLFVEMDRENRSRKDLSAWEQGLMYARALEKGLFPSNRKLAQAVGRDVGDVGKALALAALPSEVVAAFGSPLDLQFRFASPLNKALQQDARAVLDRARGLSKLQPRPAPREVLRALLGLSPEPEAPQPQLLSKDGRQVARVVFSAGAQPTSIQLLVPISQEQQDQLLSSLRQILGVT